MPKTINSIRKAKTIRRKPNVDIEFRHIKTGCGGSVKLNMTIDEIKNLKELLSMPGLDIETSAVEFPYKTIRSLSNAA